jgi:hypothetical protein
MDPSGVRAFDVLTATTHDVSLTDSTSASIRSIDGYLAKGGATVDAPAQKQYTTVSEGVDGKLWQDVSKCVSRCTQCDALNQQSSAVFW